MDRAVFDLETNRLILRNLMENGLRDAGGTRLGKTIIFARSEHHARVLLPLFYEMFPEVGGGLLQGHLVHRGPEPTELIDEFKRPDSELTIAISIDMLDTGIDVPEVVNLVFAKPVYSKVKFLQMIGRGTRTCKDLFGPGQHKTHFLIFDHWQNFEFFEKHYKPIDTKADRRPYRCRCLRHAIDVSRGGPGAKQPPGVRHRRRTYPGRHQRFAAQVLVHPTDRDRFSTAS